MKFLAVTTIALTLGACGNVMSNRIVAGALVGGGGGAAIGAATTGSLHGALVGAAIGAAGGAAIGAFAAQQKDPYAS